MYSNNIKTFNHIPLSILDLAHINEGGTARESFRNSVDLAKHADKWGFNRYWFAEHHNMPGVASSATSVIIGHIASHTNDIRVGSGGVMLPNHATLVIAEQFGTLEALFPGRIDLGLGRAPGTDQRTAFALRRNLNESVEDFPMQVNELQDYFSDEPKTHVKAIPGKGAHVPLWLLGSSGFSAQLAAHKGLPFSFASHFAPDYLNDALALYRERFEPSEALAKPHAMPAVNIIAADTQEKAEYLATSQQQMFLSLRRNQPSKFQPPRNMDDVWTATEQVAVGKTLDSPATIIGDPDSVKRQLEDFIDQTNADEIMIASAIYDHKERLRSFEILSEMMD